MYRIQKFRANSDGIEGECESIKKIYKELIQFIVFKPIPPKNN